MSRSVIHAYQCETAQETCLFFAWPLEVGSALRFLAPLSGAGVSLGLVVVVLCFAAVLPKTVPMARSIGVPPFGFAASALRLLGAGAAPGAAGVMPRPTGPASGRGFRDFAP